MDKESYAAKLGQSGDWQCYPLQILKQ